MSGPTPSPSPWSLMASIMFRMFIIALGTLISPDAMVLIFGYSGLW
jgi:hypothetical protein